MAKQRDAIRMNEAEIQTLFDEVKSLNVATLGKDGMPHLTTLWYAPEGDGVMFETYGASQKVVNLRRDPRIAVLCEAGTQYAELRGVSMNGRAEIVDQEPRLSELMRKCFVRSHPEIDPQTVDGQIEKLVRKRVVVVVHPEKVISWDHRKLATATAS